MAQLSGSEPISAANLAEVLGSGAVGGLTVLFTGDSQTAHLAQDGSAFDVLIVCIKYSNNTNFIVPVFTDSDSSLSVDGMVSLSYNKGENFVYIASGSVRAVYGIRSGGGQLLADILAALEGVA